MLDLRKKILNHAIRTYVRLKEETSITNLFTLTMDITQIIGKLTWTNVGLL